MIYINVRPKEICIENHKITGIVRKVELVENTIKSLSYRAKPEIAGRYGISQRMRAIQKEVGQLENRIEELHSVTEICMEQYRKTENEINRNAGAFD